MKRLLAISALALSMIAADCNKEDDTVLTNTGNVAVRIIPKINGETFEMSKLYKDNQNHDYWYATLKFYLSNIALQEADGSARPLIDVALFDFEPGRQGGILDITPTRLVPAGNYTGLLFDAGVRQDMNSLDPAVFDNDHPLSIKNNMYWTWNTQYIFTKNEGFVIHDNDTSSWFVHSGTAPLYQSGIQVEKPIVVPSGGSVVFDLELDLDALLETPNVLDLSVDGQSHTTDNMELAEAYQENLAQSFK